MLGYFSLDIICSSKLKVFLECRFRKTVPFLEQIIFADKYPSIFSGQMRLLFITLILPSVYFSLARFCSQQENRQFILLASFIILFINLFIRTSLLFRPDKVGCEHAYQYYGYPGHVQPERKCDETHYPDICSFQATESRDHELICDAKVCGSSHPKIGSINPDVGKITDWKASTKETITAAVQEAEKTNRKNGFGFLFIKCGDILQALTFPPKLEKIQNDSDRISININIITLDSISRPHFYRILPRASTALRKILHDPNIKASVMDFELFQSVGQQTFDNLRPFFSGVMKGEVCNKEISRFWVNLIPKNHVVTFQLCP